MSHEMTKRDGFFTVREAAWHGLGKVLPDHPTREEAQRIAHNWEPISETIYRKVPRVFTHDEWGIELDEPVVEAQFIPIEESVLNARSDDGHILGVVSSTYEPVTNAEMYDIAEALEAEDPSSVRYETGGSLKGGRKVWLLLRLKEPLLVKGDPNGPTIPYYALQNSHDGSGSFRGQALMTRIVCDNTSQAADMESRARGTEFVFRHTRSVKQRIEEAREALAGWRESVEQWTLFNEHLLTIRIMPYQVDAFVENFIPAPPQTLVSERVLLNVEKAQSDLRGIINGQTCDGISHTAYGLVQASIEYGQHYRRSHGAESLFKRAYLDRSLLTMRAVGLAKQAALA